MALFDTSAQRFFSHNRVIAELSCSTQLQLLNTLVLGAVNYLLAVLPVSGGMAATVDKRIRDVGYRILGLPRGSEPTIVKMEIPGMPFHATCTAHQVRLLEYLRLLRRKPPPLRDCLAARLVEMQLACPQGPSGRQRDRMAAQAHVTTITTTRTRTRDLQAWVAR
jgi:hypothetical protein